MQEAAAEKKELILRMVTQQETKNNGILKI
jgi:hypothetical protein